MVDGSRITKYIFLILCLIVIVYYVAPFIYDHYRTRYYGFSVDFIDQNKARTGEIIHLADEDLTMSPALDKILQGESSGSVRLNEEEYHDYLGKYPNYSQNETGKRLYYEYQGRFFYLMFIRDDLNHL